MTKLEKIYKEFKILLNWFKRGFEEETGKPSGKRKSLFAIVALLAFAVINYTTVGNVVTVIEILMGGILLLAGVATYQNTRKGPTKDKEDDQAESGK
jgi:hypothetical protein